MSIIIPSPPGSPGAGGAGASVVQRGLTAAFIAALPVSLVLTPRTHQKLPSGGFSYVLGSPRASQVMTIVEQTGLPRPTRTVDGVERVVEFEIVGQWDAQMARGDVFTYQGKDWEVVDLFFDNGYETRALVSARG